ncbi:MAG: hypothetical protein V7603_5034 [Micromonosporaceae bacterium]
MNPPGALTTVLEPFLGFAAEEGVTGLTVRPHKSISNVGTTGRPAERIIDLLYGGGASIALDRKAAARSILAEVAASRPVRGKYTLAAPTRGTRPDHARSNPAAAPRPTTQEVIAPAAHPGTRPQ